MQDGKSKHKRRSKLQNIENVTYFFSFKISKPTVQDVIKLVMHKFYLSYLVFFFSDVLLLLQVFLFLFLSFQPVLPLSPSLFLH